MLSIVSMDCDLILLHLMSKQDKLRKQRNKNLQDFKYELENEMRIYNATN